MNKQPVAALHRDPISGIAWVEDSATGTSHSCHPNIDSYCCTTCKQLRNR